MRLHPTKPRTNLQQPTTSRRRTLTTSLTTMMLRTQSPQITQRIIIIRNNMIHIRSRSPTNNTRLNTPLTNTTITQQHRTTTRRPIRRQTTRPSRNPTRPRHTNHHHTTNKNGKPGAQPPKHATTQAQPQPHKAGAHAQQRSKTAKGNKNHQAHQDNPLNQIPTKVHNEERSANILDAGTKTNKDSKGKML